jgi:L-ascorbate metabolism protein UlaG (beta-lactamase superfamily)
MKVEWFRSATVGIYSDTGTRILCDPWITNGAFIGSWFHFPKLEGFEFNELVNRKWDALYISHLHADHFDRKLVSAIARNQPDCVVILPKFAHKWLYRAVSNCGFEPNRILEIQTNKYVTLKDFRIKVFTADYCDPTVCGVGTPCLPITPRESAIDSLALFEADNQRILNANDALAVQSASKLWPLIGEIDLLLGHYGGAGPYPQSFANIDNETKLVEARKLAEIFVTRLVETSAKLKAKFVMPYAGQYVLGGSLSELNPYRSVVKLEEVLNSISMNSNSIPVGLQPFSVFNLTTGQSEASWVEPKDIEVSNYIKSIAHERYPYQSKNENWKNAEESIESALELVGDEYLVRGSLKLDDYRISIVTDDVAKSIQFNANRYQIKDGNLISLPNTTSLNIDSRLLKRIITRVEGYKGFTQYHFNQAEIGSHIEWSRNGQYNPIVSLLNFMQTRT